MTVRQKANLFSALHSQWAGTSRKEVGTKLTIDHISLGVDNSSEEQKHEGYECGGEHRCNETKQELRVVE